MKTLLAKPDVRLVIKLTTLATQLLQKQLRAILCKNQTKWEMKNFDTPLKFA